MTTRQTLKMIVCMLSYCFNCTSTEAQTSLVADIHIGAASAAPKQIIGFKNQVYCVVKHPTTGIQQIYRSNTANAAVIVSLSSNDVVSNLVVSDSVLLNGNTFATHKLYFVRNRLLLGKNQFELLSFDGTTGLTIKNLTTVLNAKDTSPIASVFLQTSTLEIGNFNNARYIHPITTHLDTAWFYTSINLATDIDSFRWTQGVNFDNAAKEIIAFPTTAVWFFPHKIKRTESHDDDFDLDDPIRTRDDNAQGALTTAALIPDTIIGLAAGYESDSDFSIIGKSEARFMFFSIKDGVKRLKSMLYPIASISNTLIPTEPYLIQEGPPLPLSMNVVKKGVYYQDVVYFKAVNSGIWKCNFRSLHPRLFVNNTTADNLTLISGRAFFTAVTTNAPNGGIFEIVNEFVVGSNAFQAGEVFQKFFTLNGFCFAITKNNTTYTFYRIDGRQLIPALGTAQNVDIEAGFALINRNILVFSANNPADGKGQELYKLVFPISTNVVCTTKPTITNCPSQFGGNFPRNTALDAATANVTLPKVTFNDACDTAKTLTIPSIDRVLSNVPLGDSTVYYTATNANGTTTCRFKVRMSNNPLAPCATETIKPIIRNCPINTIFYSYASGFIARQEHCIKLNDLDKDKQISLLNTPNSNSNDFEAYDNCVSQPIIESNVSADSCLIPNFLYTVTARARDERTGTPNRSDPCTFTIKYINLSCLPDTSGPVIFNCNDINVPITNAQTCTTVTLNNPSFRDYCDQMPSLTISPRRDTCFPKGRTLVTYTAKDRSGNKTTCTFPVSVISTACSTNQTPPTVSGCLTTPITVFTKTDSAVVTWQSPIFSDGSCGVVVVDSSHKSGTKFKIGTTTVTYKATNSRGLIRVCSFSVIVNPCVTKTKNDTLRTCIAADTGRISRTLTAFTGCDSVVTTVTTLKRRDSMAISRAICQGTSTTVGTQTFSTQGIFLVRLTNTEGCDSIIRLDLTVNPKDTIRTSATSCSITRIVMDTTRSTNQFGCERLTIRTTTPAANDTTRRDMLTCDNAQVRKDTQRIQRTGRCDSVIVTTTSLKVIPPTNRRDTICQGQSVTIGTRTFKLVVVTITESHRPAR